MTSTQDDVANVPVFDFMTRNVITIPESQTMKQASKLIYEDNIGSIVILKEGSGSNLDDNVSGSTTQKKEIPIPIGIVTERDIARMVGFAAKHSIFGDIPLSELMSKPLITIQPGASLKDAVVLMQQKDIRRLPIIDKDGRLVGIITEKDILRVVLKKLKKNIGAPGFICVGFYVFGFVGDG
jgi:CBS domain-containing protein